MHFLFSLSHISKNLFVFCLMGGLPLFAGWHGSQAVKSFGKKMMTRKDMRLGPNRSQQYQQNRWERVLAKKARAQRSLEQRHSIPVYDPVFEHSTVVDSVRTESVGTSQRHSIMRIRHNPTVFVFSFLLMAQLASGATWCSLCHDTQNHINGNKDYFDSIRRMAREHEAELGKIDFPATIEMSCPPYPCTFHWQVDHANEWYRRGRHFLDSFEAARAEFSRRIDDYNRRIQPQIDEQNRRMAMHKKYEQLREIDTYMSGQYHRLNPDYKRSFDAYVSDPEKYLSRPDQEFYADPLILMGAIAEDYAVDPCHCAVGTKKGFLKLMRSDGRYIDLVKDLIKMLLAHFQKFDLNGEKDKASFEVFFGDELSDTEVRDAKKHIAWLIEIIDKKPMEPEYLASRLEWLLKIAIKDEYGFAHLKARLNEQSQGVLYAGSSIAGKHAPISSVLKGQQVVDPPFIPGIRIVCSQSGLCGISDAVSAALGGARTDFVAADMRMRSLPDRFYAAQDLLNIIRREGQYAGEPYIGTGAVDRCVRSIQGGDKLASQVFELFAHGNTVKESYNYDIHSFQYSLILDDGTKITYVPATAAADGDALMIIDQMPRWINPDTITLRFRPIEAESQEEGFVESHGMLS
jgi:hypothetical protein